MNTRRFTSLLVVCLVLLSLAVSADQEAMKREVRMGREGCIEIEKIHKILDDPEITERVEGIGKALAEVANSEVVEASYGKPDIYPFDYKFKVLDEDDINAFSLPGGFIYLNKGLVEYAQSDHELAGVIAHEIAHAAHHHMTHLLKEQSKLDGQIALLLLAGMLSRIDTTDLGHLLIGAQLVKIAKTSGYGQKAEWDADATGVHYTIKAGFNPVGSLTFLERLAKDHSARPTVDMGIMQTHPAPKDRSKALVAQIRSLGMPVNRRAVMDALKAEVEPAVVGERETVRVVLGKDVLFEPAPISDVITAEQRAEAIATKVNQLLDSEPVFREVTVDGGTVLARGEPIIMVTPQDGDLVGRPVQEMATEAADTLRRAIWQEMIARIY